MNAIYLLLTDFTFQTVALGSMLLGTISGALGSFAVLRRQSLLGDGISHAALPGVAVAFLLTGEKHTEWLLLGAFISGVAATLLIMGIVRYTPVRFDSALATVMSVFFGLGMVLLTYIQKIPDSNQAGLKRFIFGQASALLRRDLYFMLCCGGVLFLLLAVFWKELQLFTFDSEFAHSLGLPVKRLNLLLSLLTVAAIVIGLQTVGVILMSAMLIAPAAAARQWTKRLSSMMFLSALLGAVSGGAGTIASSMTARLPTGPAIVLCASFLVGGSLLFAPGRGMIARLLRHARNKRRWARKGERT